MDTIMPANDKRSVEVEVTYQGRAQPAIEKPRYSGSMKISVSVDALPEEIIFNGVRYVPEMHYMRTVLNAGR